MEKNSGSAGIETGPVHRTGHFLWNRAPGLRKPGAFALLLDEGHAVGTLVDRRVGLMGADADAVEGAVILAAAVVAALSNVTFDAVVRFFSKMTHH